MAIINTGGVDWKNYLNVSNILLPPKDFCDIIKPKLEIALDAIISVGTYNISRFKSLEKNTIVSLLYDSIYRGFLEPNVIQDNIKLIESLIEIITLDGFRDFQISFAVVHYMSHTKNLIYEKDMDDIRRIRSFCKDDANYTSHKTEVFIRRVYSKFYYEIGNHNFNARHNELTRCTISLCKYTKDKLADDMDSFISEIMENGAKIVSDTSHTSAPRSWDKLIAYEEEKIIETKGGNKMGKLNSIGISMLTGDIVVKTRAGKYVSFVKESGIIQEFMGELVLNTADLITVIPCVKVAVGDTIVRDGKLFYVKAVQQDNSVGIIAVDIENGTEEKMLNTTNEFGITYYKKIVNVSQLGQVQAKLSQSEAQQLMTLLFVEDEDITEIGKMMILTQLQNVKPVREGEEVVTSAMNPMMMMAMMKGKDGSSSDMMKMMMLMQIAGSNQGAMNPMMMMAMMKGKDGGMDDKMMKLMMMSQLTTGNQVTGINPMMLMAMGK